MTLCDGASSEGDGLRHLLGYQVNLAKKVVHLLITTTAITLSGLYSFKYARLLCVSFLLQLLGIFVEFGLLKGYHIT